MPQMNKGGKFIFGISLIHADGAVLLPAQAVNEYEIAKEGRVILLSGSKSTGGFCVTRKGLLENSRLSQILSENPALSNYEINEGEFIKYKGRFYCWKRIDTSGRLQLDDKLYCKFAVRFIPCHSGILRQIVSFVSQFVIQMV